MGPEGYAERRSELCRRIEAEAAAVTGHCLRLEKELATTRAELTVSISKNFLLNALNKLLP